MKNWIIRTLGLKGSWSWAKRQMMAGEISFSRFVELINEGGTK